MSGIEALLPLARVLAHSLWQGPVLWLAWRGVERLLRGQRPAARYHAALLALGLLILLPLLTLWGARGWLALPAAAGPGPAAPASPAPLNLLTRQLDLHLSATAAVLVVGLWLAGALLLLGRTAVALWRLRRCLSGARPVSGLSQVRSLAFRLGVTPPRVVESERVRSPFVTGWRRPLLVLPPGFAESLLPAELEAVLLHELAHLRRRDPGANLLLAAAAAFAWHQWPLRPLYRALQREREHCCDELALAQTGRPLVLARALVSLEERRGAQPRLVLAGTGGDLSCRIHRILAWRQPAAGSASRRTLLAGAGLFWIVGAAAALAGSAEAAWFSMPVSIAATDPAGRFTVELVGERLVAATVAGRDVPPEQIVQRGNLVALHDPAGGPDLTLEVRRGGIRWQPRAPRRR